MTNKDIISIAKRQSGIDYGYDMDSLDGKEYVVFSPTAITEKARNYLEKPPFLDFSYYGDTLIAIADDQIRDFVAVFLESYKNEIYRVFDAPQINKLSEELKKHDMCIAHIADYYLPDVDFEPKLNDRLDIKVLVGDDVKSLYHDQRFKMALCYQRESRRRDEMAVVGYINGELVGVAGCSNDCDTMWQIGIDVLEEFRGNGYASTLTYHLSKEILKRDKVPFYCTAYSNIASRNTARQAGFKSAWVSLTAKSIHEKWIQDIIK